MATQRTELFHDDNGVQSLRMGVAWDDVTLAVIRFLFQMDTGNRSARFTLTRLSDNQTISHDFVPGINYVAGDLITWDPPFPMSMKMQLNAKTGLNVGVPDGWQAELTLI